VFRVVKCKLRACHYFQRITTSIDRFIFAASFDPMTNGWHGIWIFRFFAESRHARLCMWTCPFFPAASLTQQSRFAVYQKSRNSCGYSVDWICWSQTFYADLQSLELGIRHSTAGASRTSFLSCPCNGNLPELTTRYGRSHGFKPRSSRSPSLKDFFPHTWEGFSGRFWRLKHKYAVAIVLSWEMSAAQIARVLGRNDSA